MTNMKKALTELSEEEANGEAVTIKVVSTEIVHELFFCFWHVVQSVACSIYCLINPDVADLKANVVRQAVEVHVSHAENKVSVGDMLSHNWYGQLTVAVCDLLVECVVDDDAQITFCIFRNWSSSWCDKFRINFCRGNTAV